MTQTKEVFTPNALPLPSLPLLHKPQGSSQTLGNLPLESISFSIKSNNHAPATLVVFFCCFVLFQVDIYLLIILY